MANMRDTTHLATAGPCYQEVACIPQVITALVVLKNSCGQPEELFLQGGSLVFK